MFWNVAGIGNKDKEFWRYIRTYDFISLSETWMEKGWEKIRGRLSDTHKWACSYAIKEDKKGRARRGFIIGKKNWDLAQGNNLIQREEEGIIVTEMSLDREKLSIISVYGEQGGKNVEEKVNRMIGEREGGYVMIRGDFNISLRELGGSGIEEEERKSKDKIIGNGGRNLVNWLGEKGWNILNGRTEGDWKGEYTYVGARGSSVIDYVVVNEKTDNKVIEFKIDVRVDSDHMPMSVKIEDKERSGEEEEEDKTEEQEEEIEIIQWDEEAVKKYMETAKETVKQEEEKVQESKTIEEEWEEIKRIIHGAMVRKKIKKKRKKLGFKDWWDRSCTRKKREVKRIYIKWKRGKIEKEKYMVEKRKFRELLEMKQKEKREEEEEELRKMKKEVEIWKYINKKKGKSGTKIILGRNGEIILETSWKV